MQNIYCVFIAYSQQNPGERIKLFDNCLMPFESLVQ